MKKKKIVLEMVENLIFCPSFEISELQTVS